MLTLVLIAAISLPAKPDHYVTDRAGVISNPSALDAKLAQFERETSDQILVYVDQHLPPDTTIEEMGSEATRQWGVGQKGKDNGAILFVFVADRKMRIEVGYGLEGALTDAKSKRIIETVIKPQFQRGDYSAGIEQGVAAILATIRGEPYTGTGATVAEQPSTPTRETLILLLAFFIAFSLIPLGVILIVWNEYRKPGGRRLTSAELRHLIVGFVVANAICVGVVIVLQITLGLITEWRAQPFDFRIGSILFGVFFGEGIILSLSLPRSMQEGTSFSSSGSSRWSSSSSSSWSSSSSSSSSSSFSGGGGSGGGGGASGSW